MAVLRAQEVFDKGMLKSSRRPGQELAQQIPSSVSILSKRKCSDLAQNHNSLNPDVVLLFGFKISRAEDEADAAEVSKSGADWKNRKNAWRRQCVYFLKGCGGLVEGREKGVKREDALENRGSWLPVTVLCLYIWLQKTKFCGHLCPTTRRAKE